MVNLAKNFGKRLKEIRNMRGLTQSQLAEMLELEVMSISRIESGIHFPKQENIEKIAKILDVEIKDLFDFAHHQTKSALQKDINAMLKNADVDDLKYIDRMLHFYFESK